MTIRLALFARIAEICGTSQRSMDVDDNVNVDAVWVHLEDEFPALRALRTSTRAACNGTLVSFEHRLAAGDELAFLPPVGGG